MAGERQASVSLANIITPRIPSPAGLTTTVKPNAGARLTIIRPLSIEAGYRYVELTGKGRGNRDNAVADGPYVGVNFSF